VPPPFELYERVEILTDRFESEGVPAGTVGYVIERYDDGALDFELAAAPVDAPGRANWKAVLPHRAGVRLLGVDAFATHAVVHGPYYLDDEGNRIGRWLVDKGARQVGEFGGDKVYRLK